MNFSEILNRFSVDFGRESSHLEPPGSPERSLFSIVLEDTAGRSYILEKISSKQKIHKTIIINTLKYLNNNGFKYVNNYLGNKIVEYDGGLWQLAPFVESVQLKRPDYLSDTWRGAAFASFLLGLKEAAADIYFPGNQFSIKQYIINFMSVLERNDKEVFAELKNTAEYLESSLFRRLGFIRTAFCHGDLHPLNVLWSENSIRKVIDWEFLGYKPELYDLAALTGCMGIEDPDALTGDLLASLVEELREEGFAEEKSWNSFIDLVIAIRFAWMSEWLRKKDHDMQKLEIAYINLLLENKGIIEKRLNIP